MKLNTVDLYEELKKSKRKSDDVIEEVNSILLQERDNEKRILKTLEEGDNSSNGLEDKLDQRNIYSLEQIKSLCIKYRLKFLDSKHFKGEIPFEAISKIKQLEKELKKPLSHFKIIAPKKLFKLEEKDTDPLLFVQLSENKFFFIHKWGGELSFFRSILAFPLRNFLSMFWSLMGFAFLFSLAIPTPSFNYFIFLFVHSFIGSCGLACLIIMPLRENFSVVEWDSKFLS